MTARVFGRWLIGGLVLFAAGTTAAAAPTLSFTATPASVTAGGQSALNWSATNVRRCSASGAWSGSRPTIGTANVGPLTATSTFTLRCWGRGDSITRSVQVAVAATPAPTITLSAAPSSIASGGSSTLTWSSTNVTSCSASGSWSGSKAKSGTQSTGPLTANATYALTCVGAGGTANRSTTVTVTAATAPTVALSASPANIASGGSSTLTWSSTGVSTCTASGGWTGNKATSGTAAVGPLTQDATYSLSCSGANGNAVAMTSVAVRIARLSWIAPTRYSDGSALTPAGYRIYYGTTSKSYSQTVAVSGASTTQWVLSLPAGTWFFVVTVLDAAGKESARSNEARKTIN